MINIKQLIIGFTALIFGIVYYVLFRSDTYFTHKFNIDNIQLVHNTGSVIWNSFPSFVHSFSFSMITVSLIKGSWFRYFVVCTFWLMINCIFEFSQKYKIFALGIIPSWFETIPFLDNMKNFITHGTFDVMDMYSVVIAIVTAFCVMVITSQRRKQL